MGTLQLITRLVIASVLGMAIGIEREYRAKNAGIRTHFLVALGSALFMIISEFGILESGLNFDPARIAAQIVTGIGFLGAGTIILQKQSVKGLTTAAGLWTTAGIGMAVGCGMYIISVTATILVLIGYEFLNKIVDDVVASKRRIVFETTEKEVLQKIIDEGLLTKREFVSYNMKEKDGKVVSTIIVKIQDRKQDIKIKQLFSMFQDIIVTEIDDE